MKKTVLLLIISLTVILSGCSENNNSTSSIYITKDKSLEIAKKYERNQDVKWETKFEEDKEIEINNKNEKYTVWVVTANYPAGNKMLIYLNAINGQEIVMTEEEANIRTD
ncbi:lipoprotein [Cohnella sp. AR92]|uniref:lipoprotein n=1 Tax=Cohnella sp. AR92 TaxID=648716 RepID=UPI000F8E5DED|nr:lipoprotein [Cohnella sp. AR92]RUS41947.1 hypothetical protein ELR57_27555 [Cohnella sp. AR92]